LKLIAYFLIALILAGCGGGDETPVAVIKATVPRPAANAATVSDGRTVAVHVYQALYGMAPSNAAFNEYAAQAAADPATFARNLTNNFASTSSTAFANLVLDNLGVTAATVTAVSAQGQSEYVTLLDALGQLFAFYGTDARGQIILNATNLLAGLESDATYGVAAVSYNNQATVNMYYSSNSANIAAAAISTATANAGVAQNVAVGALVTLDGSASKADVGRKLSYVWTLTSKPAGSFAVLSSATADKATFTADMAGTYLASLTVNDGRLSSSTATVITTVTGVPVTILNLPTHALSASQLAVIVAAGDPLSESIASYYQSARGIPATNIIRVTLTTGVDTISATDFATLRAQIDAALPSNVQATLLTWTAPSRVVGSCAMGITSALALGYNTKYCNASSATCAATTASPYFDSESAQPWQDHGIRPSMMLGASTLAAAKALIDRGVQADASFPIGDGYLVRTSDVDRSVRYTDYTSLPALWSGSSGLQLSYIDNSVGAVSDGINGKSNVLFYFTGLAGVPPTLTSNSFRAGAIADSLTSYGGYLPSGGGQMPIVAWLDAGVTASYGTVEEPCNYTQKFSTASVLIDQYYRGATLIEAYWKSVQWPGQGLFVGEPLAQPFRDSSSFTVSAGQYLISTRSLRANSTYSLQYRSTNSGSWFTLGSFRVTRAQPQSWRVSLPAGVITQLRWLGPCPTSTNLQCTLSTSG